MRWEREKGTTALPQKGDGPCGRWSLPSVLNEMGREPLEAFPHPTHHRAMPHVVPSPHNALPSLLCLTHVCPPSGLCCFLTGSFPNAPPTLRYPPLSHHLCTSCFPAKHQHKPALERTPAEWSGPAWWSPRGEQPRPSPHRRDQWRTRAHGADSRTHCECAGGRCALGGIKTPPWKGQQDEHRV